MNLLKRLGLIFFRDLSFQLEEKSGNSHSHFHISWVLSFLFAVFSSQTRKGIFQPDSLSLLAFWLLNCPPRLQTSRRPSLTCVQICTFMFLHLCLFVICVLLYFCLSASCCFRRLQVSRRPSLTCVQICTFMFFFVFLSSLLCIFVYLTFLLLLFSQTANFKATKAYLCAPGDFLPFEVLMEQSFETCLKRQRATFYMMTFLKFASKWCC